jgi:integrase
MANKKGDFTFKYNNNPNSNSLNMSTFTLIRGIITLHARIDGQTEKFYTKIKVKDSDWNKRKEEIKGCSEVITAQNQFLVEYKSYVDTLILDHRRKGLLLTREQTKELINDTFFRISNPTPKATESFLEYFLLQINTLHRSEGTIRGYRVTRNNLIVFLGKSNKTDLFFTEMDSAFFKDYENYLRGLGTISTKDKHIKTIKSILALATKDKKSVNTDYLSVERESRSKLENDSFAVYLNLDEINQLHNLPLKDIDRIIVDYIVFACYSGLRYSDLVTLTKEDFQMKDGILYMKYRQTKTGDKVFCPVLFKEAVALIQGHNYQLPYIHQNIINRRIKEILAENNLCCENIRVTSTKNKGIHPKYKLISLHSGRRSYCTNCDEMDIPHERIMICSGHQSLKQLRKYILTTKEKAAMKMAEFANY